MYGSSASLIAFNGEKSPLLMLRSSWCWVCAFSGVLNVSQFESLQL